MLCSSPMSIMIFEKTPALEFSETGIDNPHCIIYCNSPAVFRQTDFPPAFGPEIINILLSVVRMISSGTILRTGE